MFTWAQELTISAESLGGDGAVRVPRQVEQLGPGEFEGRPGRQTAVEVDEDGRGQQIVLDGLKVRVEQLGVGHDGDVLGVAHVLAADAHPGLGAHCGTDGATVVR